MVVESGISDAVKFWKNVLLKTDLEIEIELEF